MVDLSYAGCKQTIWSDTNKKGKRKEQERDKEETFYLMTWESWVALLVNDWSTDLYLTW